MPERLPLSAAKSIASAKSNSFTEASLQLKEQPTITQMGWTLAPQPFLPLPSSDSQQFEKVATPDTAQQEQPEPLPSLAPTKSFLIYQRPDKYLEHLLKTPRLPASIESKLPDKLAISSTEIPEYPEFALPSLTIVAQAVEAALPLVERLALYEAHPDWLDADEATYVRRVLENKAICLNQSFAVWLDTPLGKEVQERIFKNRHNIALDYVASTFDTAADIHQKALIWLWEHWRQDVGFLHLMAGTDSLSFAAGRITKKAVARARCRYAKRRRDGVETEANSFDHTDEESFSGLSIDVGRATDVPSHDVGVVHRDRRIDVSQAVELVVQRMIAVQTKLRFGVNGKGKLDKRFARVPIEHITRTIIEGHLHHYSSRYDHAGVLRAFCKANGVGKNQIAHWRPIIFQYLREELAVYQ